MEKYLHRAGNLDNQTGMNRKLTTHRISRKSAPVHDEQIEEAPRKASTMYIQAPHESHLVANTDHDERPIPSGTVQAYEVLW